MAIFFQYIKGVNYVDNAPLYTFLKFQGPSGSNSKGFERVPVLYLNTSNNPSSGGQPCGHIITQGAVGQSIDTNFVFNGTVTFKDFLTLNYSPSESSIASLSWKQGSTFFGGIVPSSTGITVQGKSTLNLGIGDYAVTNKLSITSDSATFTVPLSATSITASESVQAAYFNATSDRRAKTNIKPLDFKALDFITKTPIYTFKYKETETPSIGVIAQEVQNVDLDGFKLVENEEATGKDFDYMSIHESKLVYILWKAIQEQQEEINQLKAQLKKD